MGIEKKGKYISRVYAFTARFRTLEYPSNITSFDCIKNQSRSRNSETRNIEYVKIKKGSGLGN